MELMYYERLDGLDFGLEHKLYSLFIFIFIHLVITVSNYIFIFRQKVYRKMYEILDQMFKLFRSLYIAYFK